MTATIDKISALTSALHALKAGETQAQATVVAELLLEQCKKLAAEQSC